MLNNIIHRHINILAINDNIRLWLNRTFVEESLWFTSAVDVFFFKCQWACTCYLLETPYMDLQEAIN